MAAAGQAVEANGRSGPGQAGGGAVVDPASHGLALAHAQLGEPVKRLPMGLQRRVHDDAVSF